MIKDLRLVVILWIVMVTVIVGNLLAFGIRLLIPSKKNVSKLFILNLTVSDFLMGVFLLGIIQKHRSLENEYYRYDREWRRSNSCKALGAIALLSSEVSLGTLAAIAYMRYRSVIHGISGTKVNFRVASITIIGIWAFGFCVSLTPAFVKSYFYNQETGNGFYGENALCLPLQLPRERQTGWEYCFVIFACINLLVLCYVVYIYGYMLFHLFFTNTSRVSTQSNEDIFLTMRITLVILTDIFCWIPVIILMFLSLASIVNDQEQEIYSWFVVVVFPINSAINPIIYTLFAPGIWKRTREAFQSVSDRICGSQDHGFGSHEAQTRSTQGLELVGIHPENRIMQWPHKS